jgi:copper chaperone
MALELTLPDMTCGHCVKTVTQTVRRMDPGARLDIDLGRHLVKIESGRPAAEFTQALAEEGYPAAP